MSYFPDDDTAGAADSFILNDDSVQVATSGFTRIDVLANDEGLELDDYQDLIVDTAPACGDVLVNGGSIQYRPTRDCGSFQSLSYRLAGKSERQAAIVRLQIGSVDPKELEAPVSEAIVIAPPVPVGSEKLPTLAVVDARPEGQIEDTAQEIETLSTQFPTIPATQDAPEPEAAETVREPFSLTIAMALPDSPLTDADLIAPTAALPDPVAEPEAVEAIEEVAALAPPAEIAPEPVAVEPALAEPEVAEPQAPAPQVPELASIDPLLSRAPIPGAPAGPVERDSWQGSASGTRLATVSSDAASFGGTRLDAPEAVPAGAPISLSLPQIIVRKPTTTAPGEPVAQADSGNDDIRVSSLSGADPAPGQSILSALTVTQSDFQAPTGVVGEEVVSPVKTASVSQLNQPLATQRLLSRRQQNLGLAPALRAPPGGLAPLAAPEPEPSVQIAALPPVLAPCVTPPALTLDVKPAARTEIVLVAPCYPGKVAELSFSGLSFAVPLDADGNGAVMALGFEATTAAVIRFHDGEEMNFDLPFSGINRVSRVALAWDMPVEINLHALEFGAKADDPGDVNLANARTYSDIRRTGGGFMSDYRPADGAGQFVQVYTHLVRANGKPGIVELFLDFVSRDRDRLEGTCGTGDLAKPRFTVLRTEGGRTDRPFTGRLASLACDESPTGIRLSAANSVGTLVISP